MTAIDPGDFGPKLPGRLSELSAEVLAEAAEPDEKRLGATAADWQEVGDTQRATRRRMWAERVPERFETATLDSLADGQNPQGVVSGWWDSHESATLVLRAEDSGVGKTYAAYAVANHAVERDAAWTWAWSMIDLNDALKPGADPLAWVTACECDLLVLDDLGREKITDWTIERLHGVLDARWRTRRRQIVTTNLPGQAFLDRYGDPITDRILDSATIVTVTGQPRRKALW